MKMNTVNISLPATMGEFVRENVERDYGNVSEFFRDLLRERMRREIEADVAFLNAATEGAPPGPTEAEIQEVLAIQRRVRKKLHARGL
jgi:Arc/MetJ-type ribon-helix-helix transcriptional regulator